MQSVIFFKSLGSVCGRLICADNLAFLNFKGYLIKAFAIHFAPNVSLDKIRNKGVVAGAF